jgi:hypothetical protein
MHDLDFKLLSTCFLTFALGLFTYYTIKIYFLRKKYEHIPGPPANGILGFYFGNVFEIIITTRRNKMIYMDKISEWLQ